MIDIEARLRHEPIIEMVPNPRKGRNPSYIVTLTSGMKAILKLTPQWKIEIAAYIVSRNLGFNLIPCTSPRTLKGKSGIISEFIPLGPTEVDSMEGSYQLDKLSLFAWLIYNLPGNWIQSSEGRVFALDREDAFGEFKATICPRCSGSFARTISWENVDWNSYLTIQERFDCPYGGCGWSIESKHLKAETCDKFFAFNSDRLLRYILTQEAISISQEFNSRELVDQLAPFLNTFQIRTLISRVQMFVDLTKGRRWNSGHGLPTFLSPGDHLCIR